MDVSERAFDAMQKDMSKKNVVTEEEFNKFLPLFNPNIYDDNQYDEGYLKNLITEYKNRFIQKLPITITDNSGINVIRTIPPTFIHIPAINKTIKHSTDLVTAHANINLSKDQPAHKKEMINETYKKAVGLTIENDPSYAKSKEVSVTLTEKNIKTKDIKEANNKTDDMIWK